MGEGKFEGLHAGCEAAESGTRRRWDGGDVRSRERSDRETDHEALEIRTTVGGRVGRHQLLLRGEGFGATAARLV